jgi:hypothetical protein
MNTHIAPMSPVAVRIAERARLAQEARTRDDAMEEAASAVLPVEPATALSPSRDNAAETQSGPSVRVEAERSSITLPETPTGISAAQMVDEVAPNVAETSISNPVKAAPRPKVTPVKAATPRQVRTAAIETSNIGVPLTPEQSDFLQDTTFSRGWSVASRKSEVLREFLDAWFARLDMLKPAERVAYLRGLRARNTERVARVQAQYLVSKPQYTRLYEAQGRSATRAPIAAQVRDAVAYAMGDSELNA